MITNNTKRYGAYMLRGSCAVVALMAANAAYAQSGGGGDAAYSGPSLENVVVTARRQSENLQQTPIAVSAFTGNDLKAQTAVGILDIQYQTPSLVVTPNQTAPGSLNFQIRGQFSQSQLGALDPPIGLYQDGVYMGTNVGSGLAGLLDVERVEVLKGPQGTLYGRNTTGGAIGIYTKLPVDTFEAEATAGAGNDERYWINGMVNIPIAPAKSALRLVGSKSWDGGYGTNLLNGQSLNDPEDSYIRATLKIDPTDSLEIALRGDYSKTETSGALVVPFYLQPGSGAFFGAAILGGYAGGFNPDRSPIDPAGFVLAGNTFYNTYLNGPGYPYEVTANRTVANTAEVYGTSLTVSKEIGAATVKSITSYRRVATNHPMDFDGTPFDLFSSLGNFGANHRMFTQELQLTGTLLAERMKYVVGAFYLDMEVNDFSDSVALPFLTGVLGKQEAFVNTESPAVFGQATFDITSALHFTGGLRWTREERTTTLGDYDTNYPTSTTFLECTTPPPAAAPACVASFGVKEENISYLAGLDWNVTDDIMVYLRTARGFKSGGVNERVTEEPATVQPFQAEVVTDWELGVKSEFFNSRLRLNAALYQSDYDDLQRSLFKTISGDAVSIVQNAGKATITGLEFEGQALPMENLSLRASATWTDPQYDVYIDPDGNDLSNTEFPFVSEWMYSLSGAYTIPLNAVDLRFQLDYSYRSDYNLSALGAPQDLLTQEGYGLLNGQISADFADLGFIIRGYVKNITDEFYWANTFDTTAVPAANGLGLIQGIPSRPRIYGVEVTKTF